MQLQEQLPGGLGKEVASVLLMQYHCLTWQSREEMPMSHTGHDPQRPAIHRTRKTQLVMQAGSTGAVWLITQAGRFPWEALDMLRRLKHRC